LILLVLRYAFFTPFSRTQGELEGFAINVIVSDKFFEHDRPQRLCRIPHTLLFLDEPPPPQQDLPLYTPFNSHSSLVFDRSIIFLPRQFSPLRPWVKLIGRPTCITTFPDNDFPFSVIHLFGPFPPFSIFSARPFPISKSCSPFRGCCLSFFNFPPTFPPPSSASLLRSAEEHFIFSFLAFFCQSLCFTLHYCKPVFFKNHLRVSDSLARYPPLT